jgi:hypothetical protein
MEHLIQLGAIHARFVVQDGVSQINLKQKNQYRHDDDSAAQPSKRTEESREQRSSKKQRSEEKDTHVGLHVAFAALLVLFLADGLTSRSNSIRS